MHLVGGGASQSIISLKVDIEATLKASYSAIVYGLPADGGPMLAPINTQPSYYLYGQHRDGELLIRSFKGAKWNLSPAPIDFEFGYIGPMIVTRRELTVYTVSDADRVQYPVLGVLTA